MKLRIRLKAYDHNLVDDVAKRLVELAERHKCPVTGPIPLPTEKEITTILRSPHKHKDSREQFELRTYKRIVDIYEPSTELIDVLTTFDIPAGVHVAIKTK